MNTRSIRINSATALPGERFNSHHVQATVRLATACRSELEQMCERAGIGHLGLSTPALRRILRQRLLTPPPR